MIDYRKTYHTLQRALQSIEESAETKESLSVILEALVRGAGASLGITGGRLYRRDDAKAAYVLESSLGSPRVAAGFEVPASYPPVRRLREEGLVFSEEGDPEFDPHIERRVGVRRFAALGIGERAEHMIAFTMADDVDPRQAVYILGTIRHVVNLKMIAGALLHDVAEARRIQTSLLPAKPPTFHDFQFAARTVPAEAVGGDAYDFLPLSPDTIGISVVDSCGHGLPAALMARDVVTGLRVALDVQYRAVRAIEKVNRVVARAALTSRFTSLFYAELDSSGTMLYCNAGHPPALFWRDGRIKRLSRGGIVLGVEPDAGYERDFEDFVPGATLVLYSDGITEAETKRGGFFGVEGLERLLRKHHDASAEGLVDIVFDALERRCVAPRQDDQTLVVVQRATR